jgi:diaminohydroxyphosphoribosylaminopyrimidine deaminase/5-amino-6-(5-phosphoribosylamino)uracil reductase
VVRVVYAVTDPHPEAAGGAGVLRAAGIDVEEGVLAQEATRELEAWLAEVARLSDSAEK